ncbi:MAG: peptide ABC transporter substrate-binding protein [Sphingorhabdus sp.]
MRFLLVLLGALLLASCSGGNRKNAPLSDQNTIVRLSDSDARGLDPQMVSDLASTRIASDQFEGLTRFNERGDAEPGLAKDWDIAPDGKKWTFHLRPALRFSDGKSISPAVFAKALARIRDEKSGSPHTALFAIIDRVETAGPLSVEIYLASPFPQLPALLAHPAMAALPFHRIEVSGEAWTSERPLVTSGAYRLIEWQLSQAITLAANPQWHDGAPATPSIIWRPMDNILSGMRLVLAKGADTSSDFPASRQAWLEERYPELVHTSGYLATYYFAFNTRRPPFDDIRVRQALAMAIDRQWMAETMIAAGNEPAWGLLPPGLMGGKAYKPEWASWPQNRRLSVARQLLKEAGYGPEKPLRFEIRFNSSSEHRRAAVAMATMWRELGVNAALLNSEASLHFDSLKRGDFMLARSGWVADLPAPENFLSVHRSSAGPQNYSGYTSLAFDAALDAALAEPDPKKREAQMRSAEILLLHDQPVIPLYFYVNRALVQPNIGGWEDNISNMHPSRTLFRMRL